MLSTKYVMWSGDNENGPKRRQTRRLGQISISFNTFFYCFTNIYLQIDTCMVTISTTHGNPSHDGRRPPKNSPIRMRTSDERMGASVQQACTVNYVYYLFVKIYIKFTLLLPKKKTTL